MRAWLPAFPVRLAHEPGDGSKSKNKNMEVWKNGKQEKVCSGG